MFCQVACDLFAAAGIRGDGDYWMICAKGNDSRLFRTAYATPGAPEVQRHRAPPEVAEVERLAAGGQATDVGCQTTQRRTALPCLQQQQKSQRDCKVDDQAQPAAFRGL